jgi:AcrR family transcriptional regulator
MSQLNKLVKEDPMTDPRASPGRRERAKEDKRRRILAAARELFAVHGVSGVTTQQIADRADVAVGTLFLYASTKAELLIMVQNEKFAEAIDHGLAAASVVEQAGAPICDEVLALLRPIVNCIREQVENGRTYLHELLFGDPSEPHRREGLSLSLRLESGLVSALTRDGGITSADAGILARVITSVIHVTTTATIYLDRSSSEVFDDISRQIHAVLGTDTRTSLGVDR